MKTSTIITLLLFAALIPCLMANKSCERSTTWGPKYFTEWEEDHADFDADTLCIDCHDGIKNKTVTPKNHDAVWLKKHGDFSQIKYGYKNQNVCAQCHSEAQCTSCHQQEEPQNHTEFWKGRGHGVFVGLDRSACMSCHQSVDFCERCHKSTTPTSHTAALGATTNRHCTTCHFPLTSVGGQQCAVCHDGTPSHNNTPVMPSDARHVADADCRSCHTNLTHVDNGDACTVCHTQ